MAIGSNPSGGSVSSASIVEGNKLRCPNCEELGDVFVAFKPLDRSIKYQKELNIIQVHRRDRGGCGHVFSPGDTWVMAEYLSGNLVPKDQLIEARNKIDEQAVELNYLKKKANAEGSEK